MKKKKAAESCGGIGMSKYIDSNEARRIARLKKVKSSIGSSMTQHSGWQKAQIEKRRKEQLKQRKQQAKKKPIGDGIKVETSIPIDYTTTGLKLRHQIDNLADNQSAKQYMKQVSVSNQVPLPIDPVRRRKDVRREKDNHKAKSAQVQVKNNLQVKDRLKTLSLSSNDNQNTNLSSGTTKGTNKRRSFIPRYTGRNPSSTTSQSEENKENGDLLFDRQSKCTSRATNLKKPGTKKHFQLATDLNALKREHADALKMLQELDKEENRRRSLGSASSAYSFDSDESSEHDIFERANRGGGINEGAYEDMDGSRRDGYGEYVSSSETVSEHVGGTVADESFAWLPEGIKDASHLSIVLNDEIESQEDVKYDDKRDEDSFNAADNFESEPASDDTAGEEHDNGEDKGTDGASFEETYDDASGHRMSELRQDDVSEQTEEYHDTEEEASLSSNQTDDYLSDTSGY